MKNDFLNTSITEIAPEVSETISRDGEGKIRKDFFNASISDVDPEAVSYTHLTLPTTPYV